MVIRHKKGLHARVIAMIVQKANELNEIYQLVLYFSYGGRERIPATNLMSLLAWSVRVGDEIEVAAEGRLAKIAVQEMVQVLESDFQLADENLLSKVDSLLHDNALTAEQVFSSMANGLVVTDLNDIITIFNPAAERITGIAATAALGRTAAEVLPGSRLQAVIHNKQAELGCHQVLGSSSIITNRTPIITNGEAKGAVAIFEDVSSLARISGELREVKELEERLQLVLESVGDGICVADSSGCVTYVNPAYERIVGQSRQQLLGRNIALLSPQGARQRALASGQPVLGNISRKENGVTIVANVNPIIVEGEVTGVVSVIKNVTELHSLMEKLKHTTAKAEYLEQELLRTRKPDKAFANFIGRSGKVRDVLAIAAKAAAGTATVLIRGESGTGKELVAEGIHFASRRAQKTFIRVNCAAIPPNLLESELFGHEKGAFTGAVRRKLGKFELAHKGTIFLDEIGDIPRDMQAKLLRVLQQKEFSRVGGESTLKVDVRIIAATNRDLEDLVLAGHFREDLYYRLNVISLILPSLRERPEDIPLLVEEFLRKTCQELGRNMTGISNEAMMALVKYRWPGNVRELENVIERVLTLAEQNQSCLVLADLPVYFQGEKQQSMPQVENMKINGPGSALPLASAACIQEPAVLLRWEEYEKQIIQLALQRYGSYNAAGKALGLTHKTVAAKAQKYGLSKRISWNNE